MHWAARYGVQASPPTATARGRFPPFSRPARVSRPVCVVRQTSSSPVSTASRSRTAASAGAIVQHPAVPKAFRYRHFAIWLQAVATKSVVTKRVKCAAVEISGLFNCLDRLPRRPLPDLSSKAEPVGILLSTFALILVAVQASFTFYLFRETRRLLLRNSCLRRRYSIHASS